MHASVTETDQPELGRVEPAAQLAGRVSASTPAWVTTQAGPDPFERAGPSPGAGPDRVPPCGAHAPVKRAPGTTADGGRNTGLQAGVLSPNWRRHLGRRDAGWCLSANRWCSRGRARPFFAAISRLGDGAAWYALMAALVVADGVAGFLASLHLALTGVVALALYRVLKRCTQRPRPFVFDERIRALVAPLDEFSFPSGHTLHAVAFSLVAITHYPSLAWGLAPFTASIAASRVVLGLHYPSDVVAATVLGASIAGASLCIWPWPI